MKKFIDMLKESTIDATDIQKALAKHGTYKGVASGAGLNKTTVFLGNTKIGTININKGSFKITVDNKDHKSKIESILKGIK